MNVSCPSCETVYRVDPAKVPAGGVRARCAVCSNVFAVGNAAGTSAAAPPVPPAAGGAPLQRKTGPLRAVNPFLVQDPKQKARRLARALISDMLVYHPEKRQNGLRDGTLPQLFKDEIEKSWLEYVEQVGRDLAESTPFWTEALNEILAGGKKVF